MFAQMTGVSSPPPKGKLQYPLIYRNVCSSVSALGKMFQHEISLNTTCRPNEETSHRIQCSSDGDELLDCP